MLWRRVCARVGGAEAQVDPAHRELLAADMQHLEGDVIAARRIAGEVDRAHPARAREPHDLEAHFHELAGLHRAQDSEARRVMASHGTERGGRPSLGLTDCRQ